MFETDDGRKIDVPEGLTPEEERAVADGARALLRRREPEAGALGAAGPDRGDGYGALQVRRFAREPWHGQWVEFARKGVPPVIGRGDVR